MVHYLAFSRNGLVTEKNIINIKSETMENIIENAHMIRVKQEGLAVPSSAELVSNKIGAQIHPLRLPNLLISHTPSNPIPQPP